MDHAIRRLRFHADEKVGGQMKTFLRKQFDVDEETISDLSGSSDKKFLMAAIPVRVEGSGICMANKSWLAYCGFGESDVYGKDPKDLLQGPLTTAEHKAEMGEFFRGYNIESEVTKQQPRSLEVENLVNYRKISVDGSAANTVDVPFSFTLKVSLLKSKQNGKHFKIWQASMVNERDLSGEQQNTAAQQHMRDYIKEKCGVDEVTADRVQQSNLKQFLIDPTTPSSPICMASTPWLNYCGLKPHDVLGKTPKQLMQGQLTSQKHVEQMHDFFGTYDLDKELQSAEPRTLVCEDLINYRKISQTESVPFKFTLTVSLLKSEETGKPLKVWQSVMSNEQDLTEEDFLQGDMPVQEQQEQPTLQQWLSSAAYNTTFECVGESADEVRHDVVDCLTRLGAHCEVQSLWSIQASVYLNQAPVLINVVLCKPNPDVMQSTGPNVFHVAAISRVSGNGIEYGDFSSKVQQAYSEQQMGVVPVGPKDMFTSFPETSILGFGEQWVFESVEDVNCGMGMETDASETAEESMAEQMMEAYVNTVDSGLHPSSRSDAAVTIAQLCCEKMQRALFMRVSGGAIAALQSMMADVDAEIQRCALAILLAIVQDDSLCTQNSVLSMRGVLCDTVSTFTARESHPEIKRLATLLMPFMTRAIPRNC